MQFVDDLYLSLDKPLRHPRRYVLTKLGGRGVWATQNEIDHLNHLGTHSKARKSRKELLQLYLDTMDQRDDWGYMEPDVIRTWLQLELKGS